MASILHVELTNVSGDINEHFSIDIKDQPFSTGEHVADAIDSEIQRNLANVAALREPAGRQRRGSASTNRTPKIKFGYDRDNKCAFWCSISDTQQGFRLRLRKDGQNNVLTKMGFSGDTTVEYRLRISSDHYHDGESFQADPNASILHVELTNDSEQMIEPFSIDIKDQPFSTPEDVAGVIDSELQRHVEELRKKWKAAFGEKFKKLKINFGYDRDKQQFWFSMKKTKEGFCLRLGGGGGQTNLLLTKLGFSEEHRPLAVFDDPRVFAEDIWVIGDKDEYRGRSLHQQRVRSDEGFGELREAFEKISNSNSKGKGKGRKGKERRNDRDEDPQNEDEDLAPHSENLLLAEYLFSLVFLWMYRQKGPTLKINAEATVSDACAQKFEDKLTSVCEFDVGATESDGPGSLKKVMEEIVKKARLICTLEVAGTWFHICLREEHFRAFRF